jgi:hypothetical protein
MPPSSRLGKEDRQEKQSEGASVSANRADATSLPLGNRGRLGAFCQELD